MNVFASAESRRHAIAVGAGILLATVLAYLALRRYTPFVFDPDQLRAWIDQFGVLAPLVFVAVQILQVVFAPIPGQVAALVAGYLFGPLLGIAYSMVGVVVGSAIAFVIARRYGRPAVERLLHDDAVAAFDGFAERAGLPGLFLFVLVPGLPDDVICFVGGLAHYRLRTFLVVIAAGRLPAYVLTTYAGGALARGNLLRTALVIVVLAGLSMIAYASRDRIREFAQRFR